MASLSTRTWEEVLLSMAHEAWHSIMPSPAKPIRDAAQLRRAYAHCAALTARHSRSFYLSSSLLPYDKRQATRALYAFCRVGDDIVDRSDAHVEEELDRWRRQSLAPDSPADNRAESETSSGAG